MMDWKSQFGTWRRGFQKDMRVIRRDLQVCYVATHCNALQHSATHCSMLQTSCNTLHVRCRFQKDMHVIHRHSKVCYIATRCIILQHTATRCNTLQYTATHCVCVSALMKICTSYYNTLHVMVRLKGYDINTLQHTAPHCITLQHTARDGLASKGTLQHTVTHGSTLQHIATHCNCRNG